MKADKQFEVIQDELDRFEQGLDGETDQNAVAVHQQYNGELSDDDCREQESSCSFEDFDTEVVRQMGLSPTRDEGIGANSDDEMFVARGRRHLDSLKKSTVFDELADGMSPGGCSLLDSESPITRKTRRQGAAAQALTKETIAHPKMTTITAQQQQQTTAASSKNNNVMISSMMDQLSVLKNQLRKFEQNLDGHQEVTTFERTPAVETHDLQEEKKETSNGDGHKRQMTLHELEESKVGEKHYDSESEIDPATWIGLRHGPSSQAACVTEHQFCDQARPKSSGETKPAKPVDRLCRQKQKKKTTKRRRSSSKRSYTRSNSRPKSRTTNGQDTQCGNNWQQQNYQDFVEFDRNTIPPQNPFANYPIANKGFYHQQMREQKQQQPEVIMTPYLMSAQQSSGQRSSVTSLTHQQLTNLLQQPYLEQQLPVAPTQQYISPVSSQHQQRLSLQSSIQHVSPHQQNQQQQQQQVQHHPTDSMQSQQKVAQQAMVVPCSSQPNNLADFFQSECQKYLQKIDKLKKQVAKQKTTISDKDKTILKQGKVYKEIRTVRDKLKVSEKDRIEQERMVRELKQHLADTTKENLALKRRLQKKETGQRKPSAGIRSRNLISEPISASGWVSASDQSFTPIRHVILSKNGKVVPQDLLFD